MPMPLFAEMRSTFVGVVADEVADLRRDAPSGSACRQVDLVHDRHDLEVVVDREVGVGERLRLDPLRRVDDQQRALARRERARDLVSEVDVAGRVDQVELVRCPRPQHAHGLRLDRDAALALDVHRVEQLVPHVARRRRSSVSSRMRSASVDLPWSMCAMIEKLRMWDWSMRSQPTGGPPSRRTRLSARRLGDAQQRRQRRGRRAPRRRARPRRDRLREQRAAERVVERRPVPQATAAEQRHDASTRPATGASRAARGRPTRRRSAATAPRGDDVGDRGRERDAPHAGAVVEHHQSAVLSTRLPAATTSAAHGCSEKNARLSSSSTPLAARPSENAASASARRPCRRAPRPVLVEQAHDRLGEHDENAAAGTSRKAICRMPAATVWQKPRCRRAARGARASGRAPPPPRRRTCPAAACRCGTPRRSRRAANGPPSIAVGEHRGDEQVDVDQAEPEGDRQHPREDAPQAGSRTSSRPQAPAAPAQPRQRQQELHQRAGHDPAPGVELAAGRGRPSRTPRAGR